MSNSEQADQVMPQVESELSESNLAVLMNDASIDQIMALDMDLKVKAWNKACEDVTGIQRKNAVGRSFYDVRVGAEAFPEIEEALQMAKKGFTSFLPWEKGSYSGYFEHHFIPLKCGEVVIGVLVIVHDVAHRIKAEKQLQHLNLVLAQKNKELQHKSEELTNFNWIASHDLKEPLRKIYTFIEMVASQEGQKISDGARSNLRKAQSAVQRMGLLTDDIVNFTEVTASTESQAKVDLKEAFYAALRKHERLITDTQAVVELPDLPVIIAYPEMLQHLLYHMLGNALKFHKDGSEPQVVV